MGSPHPTLFVEAEKVHPTAVPFVLSVYDDAVVLIGLKHLQAFLWVAYPYHRKFPGKIPKKVLIFSCVYRILIPLSLEFSLVPPLVKDCISSVYPTVYMY